MLSDHILYSRDSSDLEGFDITKRTLTLIIIGAQRVKRENMIKDRSLKNLGECWEYKNSSKFRSQHQPFEKLEWNENKLKFINIYGH